MRRARWVVAAVAAALCAPGCRSAPEPAPARAAAPGSARPLLVFGAARTVGAQAAAFGAKELAGYLSRELGGPVATVLSETPFALGDALAAGKVDAAWISPAGYVRAADKGAVRPLLRLTREGFGYYRSVIFTRAGSPLRTLDDLRGGSMVWTAASSASGSLFPRAYLKRIGRDPDVLLASQRDLHDYKELCREVLEGRADAGASMAKERPGGRGLVPDGCVEAGYAAAQFRVLAATDPIPNDLVAVRSGLPAALQQRLRQVLLGMTASEEGRARLSGVFYADGWENVRDEDFAPVREVKAFLEKL